MESLLHRVAIIHYRTNATTNNSMDSFILCIGYKQNNQICIDYIAFMHKIRNILPIIYVYTYIEMESKTMNMSEHRHKDLLKEREKRHKFFIQ